MVEQKTAWQDLPRDKTGKWKKKSPGIEVPKARLEKEIKNAITEWNDGRENPDERLATIGQVKRFIRKLIVNSDHSHREDEGNEIVKDLGVMSIVGVVIAFFGYFFATSSPPTLVPASWGSVFASVFWVCAIIIVAMLAHDEQWTFASKITDEEGMTPFKKYEKAPKEETEDDCS